MDHHMEAALNADICRVSGCIGDDIIENIEITLPDRQTIFIDVPADATGGAVKMQLIRRLHPHLPRNVLPWFINVPEDYLEFRPCYNLRLGSDFLIEDEDIVGADCDLASGGRLTFENDDYDDYDDDPLPAVIVDNGTGMMKAGVSGEDAPKVTFSTVVGYHKQRYRTEKDYYVGEEAQLMRGSRTTPNSGTSAM